MRPAWASRTHLGLTLGASVDSVEPDTVRVGYSCLLLADSFRALVQLNTASTGPRCLRFLDCNMASTVESFMVVGSAVGHGAEAWTGSRTA